jgi:ADP-heptose:LPS heptosyltransferase
MIPSGLGDFIMSLGIFSMIKKQYPEAILDVAVTDEGVGFLKKYVSYIDGIIVLDIKKFSFCDYFSYFLFKSRKDIKKINSLKYDLVICLTVNPLRRFLLTFIKTKEKIILPINGTDSIKEYDFVSRCGIKINKQTTFFDVFDEKKRSGTIFATPNEKRNLIINMFCSDSPDSTRDWRRWGELIEKLSDKFNIILIGKVNFDYKQYYALGYSKVIDLINKMDLSDLVFLFKESDLVLTVDSLPFHLAYAVGTPVIGLFGLVDPETRIPPNMERKNIITLCPDKSKEVNFMKGNRLKKELKKKNEDYMKEISTEDVVNKINGVFK